MTTKVAAMICPVCDGLVGVLPDGVFSPHKRYADGAGDGPDKPHTLIPCEGSGTTSGG
jgi:hypothetical protein